MHISRTLDLSQSKDSPVMYSEPEKNLAYLVSNLPELMRLDISGTNLCGFEKTDVVDHTLKPEAKEEEMEEE